MTSLSTLFLTLGLTLGLSCCSKDKDSSTPAPAQQTGSSTESQPNFRLLCYQRPGGFDFFDDNSEGDSAEGIFEDDTNDNRISKEQIQFISQQANTETHNVYHLTDRNNAVKKLGIGLAKGEWVSQEDHSNKIYAWLTPNNHKKLKAILQNDSSEVGYTEELQVTSKLSFHTSNTKVNSASELKNAQFSQFSYFQEQEFNLPFEQYLTAKIEFTTPILPKTTNFKLTLINKDGVTSVHTATTPASEAKLICLNPKATAPYHYVNIHPKVVTASYQPINSLKVSKGSFVDLCYMHPIHVEPNDADNGLFLRTFLVPPDFVERIDPNDLHLTSEGGIFGEPRTLTDPSDIPSHSDQPLNILEDIFRSMGVKFPEGSYCRFIPSASILAVYNNALGIDQVSKIATPLVDGPPDLHKLEVDLLKNNTPVESLTLTSINHAHYERPQNFIKTLQIEYPPTWVYQAEQPATFYLNMKDGIEHTIPFYHLKQGVSKTLPLYSKGDDTYSLRVNRTSYSLGEE